MGRLKAFVLFTPCYHYFRMYSLGIDPGVTGAIALIETDEHEPCATVLQLHDMPTYTNTVNGHTRLRVSPSGVLACLRGIVEHSAIQVAWIEKTYGRPSDGPVGAFTFGRSFGIVETAVVASGLKLCLVPPATWKRALGVPADKNLTRRKAMELFDRHEHFQRVKDHGRAEAALIALYGSMQHV